MHEEEVLERSKTVEDTRGRGRGRRIRGQLDDRKRQREQTRVNVCVVRNERCKVNDKEYKKVKGKDSVMQ